MFCENAKISVSGWMMIKNWLEYQSFISPSDCLYINLLICFSELGFSLLPFNTWKEQQNSENSVTKMPRSQTTKLGCVIAWTWTCTFPPYILHTVYWFTILLMHPLSNYLFDTYYRPGENVRIQCNVANLMLFIMIFST